jgi:hypothetical protein
MQPRPSGSGVAPVTRVFTRPYTVWYGFRAVCNGRTFLMRFERGDGSGSLERSLIASTHPLFPMSIISNTPQKIPRNIFRPLANTIFGPFFRVRVTSFMRPRDRKVTVVVRVYASPKTECLLLATFCSRILLIWQYRSVIFRNSQLFWGVRETYRSQLSHFENSRRPNLREHHFWAFFRGPRHKFCAAARPKGYRGRKGICVTQNQVLVVCYFLQPHFIDLAI